MKLKAARPWIICGFHAGMALSVLLVYFRVWRADPTYTIRAEIAWFLANMAVGPSPPVDGLRWDEAFLLFMMVLGGVVGAVTAGAVFAGWRAWARIEQAWRQD
jgi:hypothetical protein